MNEIAGFTDQAIRTESVQRAGARASVRLLDIDRAKGLAILLVVLGHLSREAPPGNEWYGVLKDCLYHFHMPFFMCLSGVTMYLSYKRIDTLPTYLAYMRGKFLRLMLPFLVFAVLILLGKRFAAQFVPIDNVPDDLWNGAWTILTKPITSAAGSLWYIYTLFLFYAAMPLLTRIEDKRPVYLLSLAVVLHLVPMNRSVADWFMLSQFSEYLLYLVIGFWIARYYRRWTQILDSGRPWLVCAFLILVLLYILLPNVPVITTKTALGLASIPALHAIVRHPWAERGGWLALLGAYSLTIYLFNLIFVSLARVASMLVVEWGGTWFPLTATAMFLSGLLLPILLSRLLLQRVSWLDRMTR